MLQNEGNANFASGIELGYFLIDLEKWISEYFVTYRSQPVTNELPVPFLAIHIVARLRYKHRIFFSILHAT